MTRFRLIIAAFVAVAMMSVGAAACTPEEYHQFELSPSGQFLGAIVIGWLFAAYGGFPGSGGAAVPTTVGSAAAS